MFAKMHLKYPYTVSVHTINSLHMENMYFSDISEHISAIVTSTSK